MQILSTDLDNLDLINKGLFDNISHATLTQESEILYFFPFSA